MCRQLSGAMIRISNSEDRDAPANLDRIITITGNSESVALAQYLISMRWEHIISAIFTKTLRSEMNTFLGGPIFIWCDLILNF